MDKLYNRTSINLPYKIEYINIVASFLQEVGKSYGANLKESMQLRLLSEEVFLFILKGIPKYEFDEQFSLTCTADDEGLLMNFTNHGEPLYNRNMTEFTPFAPDDNIDNVGLDIINKICDWCEYVNRGREGWSVVVYKHLDSFREIKRQNEEELERLTKEAARESLTITCADSSHAKGIISLMYKTYRYSYAKSIFYYEDKLKQALDQKKVISVIAINKDNEVVGHTAALFDSDCLAEIGMVMVNPIYRLNRTFLVLVKRSMTTFFNEEFKNVLYYNKCVTTHIKSQRSSSLTNFVPTALKISVYPRVSFVGIGGNDKKRESLIYAVVPNENKVRPYKLYVPELHRPLCDEILTKLMLNYQYGTKVSDRAECDNIKVHSVAKTKLTAIEVDGAGEDLFKRLKEIAVVAMRNEAVTMICEISASEPLPQDFDNRMKTIGYFFSGIEPCPKGGWRLVYTNLLYQHFDFDDIHLHDPLAVKIREYARTLYQEIEL